MSVILSGMIAVIIAGGSGTRLWPLSTPDYPKHLLSVNGENRSLLQKTYDRVHSMASTVYVVTDASHAHHVKQQLPELLDTACIVEPSRGGTANCTAAAMAVIAQKHDPDEAIFVLWADHHVRDIEGFARTIGSAVRISERERRLVLVGIEPDYPATGFGYIQKDQIFDEAGPAYDVLCFKEKPDYETAKTYLRTGSYLWNSGYLIGSLATFQEAMRLYSPEMLASYTTLLKADAASFAATYANLVPGNIDNVLTEKVEDLLVVPATFDWMDLGSYLDLHKASELDGAGNYMAGENIITEGVENSYIENQENKPIVVMGLDNIVVVNTKDGILVSRKDLSQKIGDISKQISAKENI